MSAQLLNKEEQTKYSRILSSLFSSLSTIVLSMLCLLNSLTLDIYSAFLLLKVVVPAGFCFWFIGFVIGRILDGFNVKIVKEKDVEEKKAYEIPSMFASDAELPEDSDFGVL